MKPQRNRERFNVLWRGWYSRNAKRKYSWQKRRRAEIKAWWASIKSTKQCEVCGEHTSECLQFHHLDPATKLVEVSTAVGHGWSRERILAEVAKCRVLCANCHLKLHWDERQKK